MDAFSPIPDHTGFKARNLFADGQQILKGGAFAKIAPGGGGPFPRTAMPTLIYSLSPVERSLSCLTEKKERFTSTNPSSFPAAFCTPSGTKSGTGGNSGPDAGNAPFTRTMMQ